MLIDKDPKNMVLGCFCHLLPPTTLTLILLVIYIDLLVFPYIH